MQLVDTEVLLLGTYSLLVITVISVETSVIEETTTDRGYHITVTKQPTVEICASEELPLVCTKDTVVVMKFKMDSYLLLLV